MPLQRRTTYMPIRPIAARIELIRDEPPALLGLPLLLDVDRLRMRGRRNEVVDCARPGAICWSPP